MADPPINPYDALTYPGHAFPQTHPRQLATIAHFHGMNPAPLAAMRVLELGCGTGGNLVPMALQNPSARFVGIDLSGSAIAAARESAAAFGVSNIVFQQGDIGAIPHDFGTFDYIIAHGVYSWVPPAIRDAIMALYGALLAPQGVGYISYNALPGCRLRDLARDLMLFKTRHISDPRECVRVARDVLKAYAEATEPDSFHGAALRRRLEQIGELGDDVFFHDDLNPGARAFLFHEVAQAAGAAGLRFLSEASFPNQFGGARAPVQALLAALPGDDVIEREQSLDLLIGRSFRETLFCRADVALRRGISAQALRPYHLAADVSLVPAGEEAAAGVARFQFTEGVRLSVDLPQCKAALHRLARAWPDAISYTELVAASLADSAGEITGDPAGEQARLDEALVALFKAGLVEIHREAPVLETQISDRPLASAMARAQAETGAYVVDLRHRSVALDGPVVRKFVCLLDGTRNAQELLEEINAFLAQAHAGGGFGTYPKSATAEEVAQHLRDVARLGLLVA